MVKVHKRIYGGFTIVELLIVIIVISVLAAISIIAYGSLQKRAAQAAVQSELASVSRSIDMFYAQNDTYPVSISDCPTPSIVALCINSASTLAYQSFVANQLFRGTTRAIAPAYQLTADTDKAVIFSSNMEVRGEREFTQYVDLAPIIDKYGQVNYKLRFDIKSADISSKSNILIYFQNGSGARHQGLYQKIPVTTDYTRHEIIFKPSIQDASMAESWLAFYGEAYNSGNIPYVKNVRLELVP